MIQLTYRQARLMSLATDLPQFMSFAAPMRADFFDAVVLRDYQLEILQRVAALMAAGYRRVLVQLPTGAGKTVIASQALLATTALGYRSQFWVHRRELINQTSLSFIEHGIPHGFIASGRTMDLSPLTTLAGVQTLVNRLDVALPPNLIIVDECHHATAQTYADILAAYPDAFILGLTATPERLDGRGLDEQFDIMVKGPPPAELIARGFLSTFEYYAPERPDLSGIDDVAGEFHKGQIASFMDKPALIGNVVEHYLKLAKGEKGIVFATSRRHSRNLAGAFCEMGVRAAHVDGDSTDRDEIDAKFRNDELEVLTNVGLFDEGYDVPGIVYVGDASPTKSRVKFSQKAGRALRVIYGKGFNVRGTDAERLAAIAAGPKRTGVIADHAGNAFVHGLPDEPYDWKLTGRTKRTKGVGDDAEPVRQCLKCFRAYPSKAKVCPGCGETATPTPREIEQRAGELARLERENKAETDRLKKEDAKVAKEAAALLRKVEAEQAAIRRKIEEKACSSFADFEALAIARGYPTPKKWAAMRMDFKLNYRGRR